MARGAFVVDNSLMSINTSDIFIPGANPIGKSLLRYVFKTMFVARLEEILLNEACTHTLWWRYSGLRWISGMDGWDGQLRCVCWIFFFNITGYVFIISSIVFVEARQSNEIEKKVQLNWNCSEIQRNNRLVQKMPLNIYWVLFVIYSQLSDFDSVRIKQCSKQQRVKNVGICGHRCQMQSNVRGLLFFSYGLLYSSAGHPS